MLRRGILIESTGRVKLGPGSPFSGLWYRETIDCCLRASLVACRPAPIL
jgi:hypothetical protein